VNQKQYREQVVSIARAEHQLIYHAIENFGRLLTGYQASDAAQFDKIQKLLAKELVEHFNQEEEQVFPALLADNPGEKVTQLVVELRQEHVPLLERMGRLNELLHRSKPAKYTGDNWQALIDFFLDLKAHASKEDALFALLT
jgi:iron-sulfur cluster repair protein YtfE (RIC family)